MKKCLEYKYANTKCIDGNHVKIILIVEPVWELEGKKEENTNTQIHKYKVFWWKSYKNHSNRWTDADQNIPREKVEKNKKAQVGPKVSWATVKIQTNIRFEKWTTLLVKSQQTNSMTQSSDQGLSSMTISYILDRFPNWLGRISSKSSRYQRPLPRPFFISFE